MEESTQTKVVSQKLVRCQYTLPTRLWQQAKLQALQEQIYPSELMARAIELYLRSEEAKEARKVT